jgi:hypothetical protein
LSRGHGQPFEASIGGGSVRMQQARVAHAKYLVVDSAAGWLGTRWTSAYAEEVDPKATSTPPDVSGQP